VPNVFFTDRPFRPGDLIHTRDYCEINRQALEALPPEHQEVEDLLEGVRREVIRELPRWAAKGLGDELPQRTCSITIIPWPRFIKKQGQLLPRGRGAGFVRERAKDPVRGATYCYYVTPKRDAKRVMTDERWVDGLVQDWDEVQGTDKAVEFAHRYWTGSVMPGSYLDQTTFLVEGSVMIDAECLG
jgi:hypothetical protein